MLQNFFCVELSWYFYLVVCHAGYFYEGPGCTLCTGNTIKTTAGNAANCDADQPCDGMKTVPTEDHTGCGTSSWIFGEFVEANPGHLYVPQNFPLVRNFFNGDAEMTPLRKWNTGSTAVNYGIQEYVDPDGIDDRFSQNP